uniref:Uncharacterized protein n=1 Tax=Oryza rufipogon TaxID=4529 RepID=A0A2I4S627_ORYRU|nr:hypothetical protein YJ_4 [Oryza rufipogon]
MDGTSVAESGGRRQRRRVATGELVAEGRDGERRRCGEWGTGGGGRRRLTVAGGGGGSLARSRSRGSEPMAMRVGGDGGERRRWAMAMGVGGGGGLARSRSRGSGDAGWWRRRGVAPMGDGDGSGADVAVRCSHVRIDG